MKYLVAFLCVAFVAATLAADEVQDRGYIPIVCGICKSQAGKFDLEALKKLPKAEFQTQLDTKVCGTVPAIFKADCSKFVVKNIDNIYTTVQNGGGPKELCVAIGVC